MREDLDFLFQRAMRSKDWRFIGSVEMLFIESGREMDTYPLHNRILNLLDLDNMIWGAKLSVRTRLVLIMREFIINLVWTIRMTLFYRFGIGGEKMSPDMFRVVKDYESKKDNL